MTEQEIERTLKWYCRDCPCNDRCKERKCAFHNLFKEYLKGDEHSLPPKEERNVRDKFHRFHRQLIHNLEEEIYKCKEDIKAYEDKEHHKRFIKGMEVMLSKVKSEIEYLNKDE